MTFLSVEDIDKELLPNLAAFGSIATDQILSILPDTGVVNPPFEGLVKFEVTFLLSNTQNIYERESETILNLFGDIGGF